MCFNSHNIVIGNYLVKFTDQWKFFTSYALLDLHIIYKFSFVVVNGFIFMQDVHVNIKLKE